MRLVAVWLCLAMGFALSPVAAQTLQNQTSPGLQQTLPKVVIPQAPGQVPSQPQPPSVEKPNCPRLELAVFGMDLLQEGPPPSPVALDRAVSARDYRLGPGDRLTINIWRTGKPPNTFDVVIPPEGKVFLPAIGDILTSGLTIDQFKHELVRAVTSHIPGFQVSLLLTDLRSFRVLVMGEVSRPGFVTVTAVTRLSEAVSVACVSAIGSIRNIQLRRATGPVRTVDLYRFLIRGKIEDNPLISDGDVVFIPQRFGLVQVVGAAGRPGPYEIRRGETLRDLLAYAGGPAPDAFLERAELSRLRPADGENANRDVLPVNLTRVANGSETSTNLILQPGDVLSIYSLSFFRGGKVEITGSVRNPGQFELTNDMTLRDLLFRSGGLLPDADLQHAQLERIVEGQKAVTPVDLVNLLLRGDDTQDIRLQSDDALFIPSLLALAKVVFVEGRVAKPGGYTWRQNETVSTLLVRAGGVILASASPPSPTQLSPAPADLQAAYLERTDFAGEKTRLPVDLYRLLVERELMADVGLQPGDVLVVPARVQQVFVEGLVQRPGAYAFEPNRLARHYVGLAGPQEHANLGKVLVKRQDGSIIAGLEAEVLAGDTIVVPKSDVISTLQLLGLIVPILDLILRR